MKKIALLITSLLFLCSCAASQQCIQRDSITLKNSAAIWKVKVNKNGGLSFLVLEDDGSWDSVANMGPWVLEEERANED